MWGTYDAAEPVGAGRDDLGLQDHPRAADDRRPHLHPARHRAPPGARPAPVERRLTAPPAGRPAPPGTVHNHPLTYTPFRKGRAAPCARSKNSASLST